MASHVMPFTTICSHAVETMRPPIVFFVDHRSRWPLCSASASNALAAPPRRGLSSAIQPHDAGRLYFVIVYVDESGVYAYSVKPDGEQRSHNPEPGGAIGAGDVRSFAAQVAAVLGASYSFVVADTPHPRRYAERYLCDVAGLVQHKKEVSAHAPPAAGLVGAVELFEAEVL
jgi:hypothetical protein